jgi:hypothetical protein
MKPFMGAAILFDSGLSAFNHPGGDWNLALPQVGTSLITMWLCLYCVLFNKSKLKCATPIGVLGMGCLKIGLIMLNFLSIDVFYANWIFYSLAIKIVL